LELREGKYCLYAKLAMVNPRSEPARTSCQWSVDEETCISFVNRSTKNLALTPIIHGTGDGDECGSEQR